MGRAPCCEKTGLKRGPWTQEEDQLLVDYIKNNGHGSWRSLPKLAGTYNVMVSRTFCYVHSRLSMKNLFSWI
jgi:hypothetical protein